MSRYRRKADPGLATLRYAEELEKNRRDLVGASRRRPSAYLCDLHG
jgi:hypothetical protein